MDTQIVEVRKNVLIAQQINNINVVSFTTRIDSVNFIPDEVIVKLITFNSADPQDNPYNRVVNIYTNLVDNYCIGSITDVGSIFPNLTFTLRKPIGGEYIFELFTVNHTTFNFIGDISIHLEFIKYRTDLPDKKIF